jgi:hypothetical protein
LPVNELTSFDRPAHWVTFTDPEGCECADYVRLIGHALGCHE